MPLVAALLPGPVRLPLYDIQTVGFVDAGVIAQGEISLQRARAGGRRRRPWHARRRAPRAGRRAARRRRRPADVGAGLPREGGLGGGRSTAPGSGTPTSTSRSGWISRPCRRPESDWRRASASAEPVTGAGLVARALPPPVRPSLRSGAIGCPPPGHHEVAGASLPPRRRGAQPGGARGGGPGGRQVTSTPPDLGITREGGPFDRALSGACAGERGDHHGRTWRTGRGPPPVGRGRHGTAG